MSYTSIELLKIKNNHHSSGWEGSTVFTSVTEWKFSCSSDYWHNRLLSCVLLVCTELSSELWQPSKHIRWRCQEDLGLEKLHFFPSSDQYTSTMWRREIQPTLTNTCSWGDPSTCWVRSVSISQWRFWKAADHRNFFSYYNSRRIDSANTGLPQPFIQGIGKDLCFAWYNMRGDRVFRAYHRSDISLANSC